jgi:hypothetical protein
MKKNLIKKLIIIFLIITSILVVRAASFSFNPNPNGIVFNATEDQQFIYDVNVTVNETLVDFSSDAADQNFSVFNMSTTTGLISFIPRNNDVGLSNWITIIATNKSEGSDYITAKIRFNISNSNDAPNITSFSPSNTNQIIIENNSIEFKITVSDDDLIHGDVLNYSWYLNTDLVNTSINWTYTPGFCGNGTYNVTFNVSDSYNASSSQEWNLTVTNNNRAPIQNLTISNITWEEETNLTNNITLSDYFYDPDNISCNETVNITYSVEGNSSIKVVINQTSKDVSFLVEDNFYGVEYIIFIATDGTNSSTSNNITLNVTNVNDAPVLNFIANQSPVENLTFILQINASDIENDTLYYWSNSTMFQINTTTGLINFTPNSSHVGGHYINISVNDSQLSDSQIVFFNVLGNNRPTLTPIGWLNATEGMLFQYNVTATDADSEDNLTFYTNTTLFTIITINNSNSNGIGLINFTPLDSDVGNYSIKISVNDSKGAVDSEIINFSVIDVNFAPNLTFIPNQTIRVDKLFELNITANDSDINDNLTFYDNTTLFNITTINSSSSNASALISFTPVQGDIGNHSILITVSDGRLNTSQIVLFTITENSPPLLNTIGSQNLTEDQLFTLYISGNDSDNDALTFSANTSMFSISSVNSTYGLINFTPTQSDVGNHSINFTVSDGDLTDSEVVWFNITEVNDVPYFDPPLPDMNATVNITFIYDVNATDEENSTLIYSDNATIFNISNTTGLINFTPTNDMVGNYSINLSVTDSVNTNSTVIFFRVWPINYAPNITSFWPNTTNVSVKENSSIVFNVSADDANNESLSYAWYLNSTLKSTTYVWTYIPNFTEAGFYNVTVIVSDERNAQDFHSWNLTVNNTNRLSKFGMVIHTTESDFNSGTLENTNVSLQSGNITLAKINSTHYYSRGNFSSSTITIPTDSQGNTSLVSISWLENRPNGTNISFYTRTSSDNSTWTNWSSAYTNSTGNGIIVNSSKHKYIQYRVNLTTSNTSITPVIEEVVIRYNIPDFTGNEDTIYNNWIDLDDYFSDDDIDDILTYSTTTISGLTISIDNTTHRATLTPDANWYGTVYVRFIANDSYNITYSNNITITFIDVAEPTSAVSSGGGGGGGGGVTTITRTNVTEINKTKYSFIELIVPERLSVGINSTIEAPILLQNKEDITLRGIWLSAYTNVSDIEFRFSKNYINILKPKKEQKVYLYITNIKSIESFSVKITANITTLNASDSAVILVDIAENISEKVRTVRDLLKLNPECLELNELLEKAELAIKNYNYKKAENLLDSAIEGCKYLVSISKEKEVIIEKLSLKDIINRIISNKKLLYILIAIFTTFVLIIYIFVKKKEI